MRRGLWSPSVGKVRENRNSVCDASIDDMQHLMPSNKEQEIGLHPEDLAKAAA